MSNLSTSLHPLFLAPTALYLCEITKFYTAQRSRVQCLRALVFLYTFCMCFA